MNNQPTLGEGNTPLEEFEINGKTVYLKREDLNPNASFKDRSLPYWLFMHYAEGKRNFVISSSGNAARSAIAYSSKFPDARLKVFVSENIPEYKLKELDKVREKYGLDLVEIEKVKRPKSDAIKFTREAGAVNLRGSVDDYALVGFEEIANELYREIPDADAVFICCSSGTSTVGIYSGYKYLSLKMEEREKRILGKTPLAPLDKGVEKESPPIKPLAWRQTGENLEGFKNQSLNSSGIFSYDPKLVKYAKENRNNPTASEKKLWYEILSNRDLSKYKFLRQKPIHKYILDFYCSKLLLGIEIDGDSHSGKEVYDKVRDSDLADLGIKIIRYTQEDVLGNIESLYEDLVLKIKERELEILQKTPLAPLDKGEREEESVFDKNEKKSPPVKGDLGGLSIANISNFGKKISGNLTDIPNLKIPSIHIVQTTKIHPIAEEFDKDFEPSEESLANAVSDKVAHRKNGVVNLVRETKGFGWVVSDEELKEAKKLITTLGLEIEGYNAYVTVAGYLKAIKAGKDFKKPVLIISGI